VRTWPAIEQLAHRVETAAPLDRPAQALAAVLRRVVRPGPVEDVLTGTTLGHPLHPVLIAFPIGSWAAATVLDVARADATRAGCSSGWACSRPRPPRWRARATG
jgi:hypothetical protein